jgi:hypothetical protein
MKSATLQLVQSKLALINSTESSAKRKMSNFAALISTIGLVGSFLLVVPIGTGPDSGAHSVMTYCANGSQDGICEFIDDQKDIVYRKVKIPSGVSGIGICHGNNLEKNASCDEPWRSNGLTSFYLDPNFFSANTSVLLYTEFFGNKKFKIYLERYEESRLVLTVNNKNVANFNLNSSSQLADCKWPCTSSINNSNVSSRIPIITIIPNTTTRLFMVLIDKKLVIEYNDLANPPDINSLSDLWLNNSLRLATSEELFQRFSKVENAFEEAYFTDNYNPPFIYKFLGNFVADTPRNSLENFRSVSFLLITSALLLTFLLFLNSIYFSRFVIAFILAGSVYGLYLFATNNTSSYAFLGCLMLSAIPLLLFEENAKFSRLLLFAYFIFAIFLSTGRVDGLFFSCAGFVLMTLLKPPKARFRWLSLTLGLILLASFWFVYKNFPAARSIHMTRGLLGSLENITLNNVLEIPGLMLGLTGDRGPLNIWGLGQLDVPLPSIIPLLCGLAVAIFAALALLNTQLKSLIVLGAAIAIWFLPFALTLASYHAAPGGWMFPRYGMSQYGILVLILVILAIPRNSLRSEVSKLSLKPLIFGFASSLFAILICIFILTEKYMNGILLDKKDAFLPAIKHLGEWVPTVAIHYREIDLSNGWQPYLINNPYALLMLVLFLMIILAVSVWASLRQDQDELT